MGDDSNVFDIPVIPKKIAKKKEQEKNKPIIEKDNNEEMNLPIIDPITSEEKLINENEKIEDASLEKFEQNTSDLSLDENINDEVESMNVDLPDFDDISKDESNDLLPIEDVSNEQLNSEPEIIQKDNFVEENKEDVLDNNLSNEETSGDYEADEIESLDLPVEENTTSPNQADELSAPQSVADSPNNEDINNLPLEEVTEPNVKEPEQILEDVSSNTSMDNENFEQEPEEELTLIDIPLLQPDGAVPDINDIEQSADNPSVNPDIVATPDITETLDIAEPENNVSIEENVASVEAPLEPTADVQKMPITVEDTNLVGSEANPSEPMPGQTLVVEPVPSNNVIEEMIQGAESEPVDGSTLLNNDGNSSKNILESEPIVASTETQDESSEELSPFVVTSNQSLDESNIDINPVEPSVEEQPLTNAFAAENTIPVGNPQSDTAPIYNNNTVAINQNDLEPTTLNVGNVVIPESLDQNYGVIADNPTGVPTPTVTEPPLKETKKPKKDKKEKPKKERQTKENKPNASKKSSIKIIILVLVGLFLVGIISIGLIIYKLFSVNFISATSSEIRRIANNYDSILNSIEAYQIVRDKDEWQFTSTLSSTKSDITSEADIDGGMSKPSNKFALKSRISAADNKYNFDLITLGSSLFLRYDADSYFYRFIQDNDIDLNSYIDIANLKPILNSIADIIDKNISKNSFTGNIMRVTIDGKVKLVNNYTTTLPKEKALEIVHKFLNSITNPILKEYLSNIGIDHIYGDVELNFHVSLKGLQQIVISNNGHQIKFIIGNKDSSTIIYDDYKITINKINNKISVTTNNKEKNISNKIDITWDSSQKDNSGIYNLKINYNDNKVELDTEVKPVDTAILDFPSNFILNDDPTIKEQYTEEYDNIIPVLERFNLLKK